MTGRRTSDRNLRNRKDLEATEKPAGKSQDERRVQEPLPEKRARTSTRSVEFDYTRGRRTRRAMKAAGELANVKFTAEEPQGKSHIGHGVSAANKRPFC